MSQSATEQLHKDAKGLDARDAAEMAAILAAGQQAAAGAVDGAVGSICAGAKSMAASLQTSGSLYYIAAGSSGLMAAADAMELGGTFGIPASRINILMAGGVPTSAEMPGDTEDDRDALTTALANLSAADTILAVSASGTTPYTMEAVRIAKPTGATVIGIANNPDTPLLKAADHAILLPTPPEVISGSTRMGAGTAQKIALNMLSTLMAKELGHIHDGMMVNMHADNTKLRGRARQIVRTIAKVDDATASAALKTTGGALKPAILIAAGAETAEAAQALLDSSKGHLRPALQRLT
ncbi:N-acetylmuramic acid 6-phosphate etherase [Thalassobius sp. MITS945101]|uniref:N-acetylmuramic acid 6-phosphate etherase n=1 Tax=Thalassobius sp. MITS945101 TaxID=3096994 RepID=UPI00399A4F6A